MGDGQILMVTPDLSYLGQPQLPYHNNNTVSFKRNGRELSLEPDTHKPLVNR